MRHAAIGDFLKVVRRQPVVLVANKGLEEMPGPPRDPPQRAHFLDIERDLGRSPGKTDPVGRDRRAEPGEK